MWEEVRGGAITSWDSLDELVVEVSSNHVVVQEEVKVLVQGSQTFVDVLFRRHAWMMNSKR